MGLSPQRPLYRAYQQDPERVAEWKKSAYPKIRKLAAEEGASIFFADEASIGPIITPGPRAPVGRPVVITTARRGGAGQRPDVPGRRRQAGRPPGRVTPGGPEAARAQVHAR